MTVTEVRLRLGNPVIITRIGVNGFYASENGADNPRTIFNVGSWKKIPPANTVNELKNLDGEEAFVTVGSLYVWKRMS